MTHDPDPEQRDVGTEQWLEVLELLVDLLTAGDAILEVMDGTLNKTVKSREQAVPIIKRRVDAYATARAAAITYARKMGAMFE